MSKIEKVKELLGLGKDTDKEDMSERHRKIIKEIKKE